MFCSFFSKFASSERAAPTFAVYPRYKITPRVPRARRVQHLDARAHRAEIFQADLPQARLGQRPAHARSSRPSTSLARQGHQAQEARGLARDGAAFAHGQGLQAHEGDAVAHGLPTLFSSGLSGGRATSTSLRTVAPTLVRAGGQPARARRRVYISIYIYYGLYFWRFTTEAPM